MEKTPPGLERREMAAAATAEMRETVMEKGEGQSMEQAREALAGMIEKSARAQAAFRAGSAQHTLLKNRIAALETACALTEAALSGDGRPCMTTEQLDRALPPLRSLMSKSEKARTKLKPDTWQYRMLDKNLAALRLALKLADAARKMPGSAG